MTHTPAVAQNLHDKFADSAFAPGTVVVPLDGSSASEAALTMGCYLADAFGIDLRIVHAIEGEVGESAEAVATFEHYVSELLEKSSAAGARVTTEVTAGSAPEVILNAASATDLIVIASHGRGGMKAMFFGSVADKVVRGAQGPVMVVPVTQNLMTPPIHTVLIAVDDSECAAHAAAIGRSLAARIGASVSLVNSYMPIPVAAGFETPYVPASAGEFERQAANELVLAAVEPGEHGHVVFGPTVEAITDLGTDVGAGLFVTGSSGKGFFGRLLAGSVSESLMHTLDRPLLIVPAPEE